MVRVILTLPKMGADTCSDAFNNVLSITNYREITNGLYSNFGKDKHETKFYFDGVHSSIRDAETDILLLPFHWEIFDDLLENHIMFEVCLWDLDERQFQKLMRERFQNASKPKDNKVYKEHNERVLKRYQDLCDGKKAFVTIWCFKKVIHLQDFIVNTTSGDFKYPKNKLETIRESTDNFKWKGRVENRLYYILSDVDEVGIDE